MSVPEYTVRIISHKCDKLARRDLISYIAGKTPPTPPSADAPSATTTTRLSYDTSIVNIIDCDFDALDRPVTPDDILFMDFRSWYDGHPQYAARITWLEQFGELERSVWLLHGNSRKSDHFPKNALHIDAIGFAVLYWNDWLAIKLNVSGIQTVDYMFREPNLVSDEIARPGAESAPNTGHAFKMTITIPEFAKVEVMSHDPAARIITIRFG